MYTYIYNVIRRKGVYINILRKCLLHNMFVFVLFLFKDILFTMFYNAYNEIYVHIIEMNKLKKKKKRKIKWQKWGKI